MEAIITAEASSSNPDLDLALRHRYGDPQAFEEVYASHREMVFNLAYRMAGSVDQAEDLSQEIFLRVFRFLGRFNGRSKLKTWIYRIALNQCRSRLGRRRLLQPLADDDEGERLELVDPGPDPEAVALAHDASRQVARALLRVRPVFREAVVLRDLEGLSYDEIAEVLRVRIGTVRSRIARGRDQLRAILETAT